MCLYLYESISTFPQCKHTVLKLKCQVLEYKAKYLNHMPTETISDCYILAKHFDLKYPSIEEHHITF